MYKESLCIKNVLCVLCSVVTNFGGQASSSGLQFGNDGLAHALKFLNLNDEENVRDHTHDK